MKEVPYELLASYFANECSKEEKAKVESWRDTSEENKLAFNDFAAVWDNSTDNNDFQPDAESALDLVNKKIQTTAPSVETLGIARRSINAYYRIAAIIIVSIGIGLGYIFVQKNSTIEIATLENEKQEILLADGSKVWLNSLSTFKYPRKFNNKTRKVFLKGEAFFEVAKNPEKPFIVESENSLTRVTGTAFNVKTTQKEVVITVEEGSVLVSSKEENSQSVDLIAKQKAVVNVKEKSVSKQVNTDLNYTAWKTGKLKFKNTPLTDAVKTLENHYKKDIDIVKENGIDTLSLTSDFDNNSFEEVIHIIELGLKIKAVKKGEKIVLQKTE